MRVPTFPKKTINTMSTMLSGPIVLENLHTVRNSLNLSKWITSFGLMPATFYKESFATSIWPTQLSMKLDTT